MILNIVNKNLGNKIKINKEKGEERKIEVIITSFCGEVNVKATVWSALGCCIRNYYYIKRK